MEMIRLGDNHGQDIFWDLEQAVNGHVAICGRTGSGKSVAGYKLLADIVQSGGTVVAFSLHNSFDIPSSLPDLQTQLKNVMNDVNVARDGITGPFLMCSDGNMWEDAADDFVDIFADALSLRVRQKRELRYIVDATMEDGQFQTLGLKALEKGMDAFDSDGFQSLVSRLYPLIRKNVFRFGESFIIPGKLNTLCLSEFNDETQILISKIVMSFLWKLGVEGKFKKEPLFLFADESQNIGLGEKGIFLKILQEGRKYGINLIFITPTIGGGSTIAQRISQAGLQLYFSPPAGEELKIAKLINPTNAKANQAKLHVLKRGECMAVGTLRTTDQLIAHPLRVDFSEQGQKDERKVALTEQRNAKNSDSDKAKLNIKKVRATYDETKRSGQAVRGGET